MSRVQLKSPQEIELLKESGKILAEILHLTADKVRPGVSTGELNDFAEKKLVEYGVEGAFKGYHGFPAAMCTSVNDACVHGIPSFNFILQEGDLLKLDFGVKYKGLITDSAITVAVGEISDDNKRLLDTTKKSLEAGLKQAFSGNTTGDIGAAVQEIVEEQGFSVVKELIGHGVGYEVHEAPEVPNHGPKSSGFRLVPGLVIAVEPIVSFGAPAIYSHKDEWTLLMRDGSMSAHFEHSLAITENGPLVLTSI